MRQRSGICNLYAHIVKSRRAGTVVEFGSAFGVSGMYFVAALEAQGHGHLYTFEVNSEWAAIARGNLAATGSRFVLTEGAFEDHASIVTTPIDVCLIDAIHTTAFVLPQLDIVRSKAAPGAIVLFDDIDFSADMRECWRSIVSAPYIPALLPWPTTTWASCNSPDEPLCCLLHTEKRRTGGVDAGLFAPPLRLFSIACRQERSDFESVCDTKAVRGSNLCPRHSVADHNQDLTNETWFYACSRWCGCPGPGPRLRCCDGANENRYAFSGQKH